MSYLLIDTYLARKAVLDKGSFDALCLGILFKSIYRNSVVYHHTKRELKQITHLGTERLDRAVSVGRARGIFVDCNGGMKVVRLWRRRTRKDNRQHDYYIKVSCSTDFKDIAKSVRKELLLFKAQRLDWLKNTTLCDDDPSREVTKARLRQRKRFGCMDFNRDTVGTISRRKFAEYLNVSVSTFSTLVSELVASGRLQVRNCFLELSEGKVSLAMNKYDNEYGFLIEKRGKVCRQMANYYVPIVCS